MNELPGDWLDQLKQVYPNRSGPMSWPRVFLKVRRALFESSWESLIEGVKRYARYCQEAGIEGSAFVVAPARFFEDEIYLEDLSFCAAEDPKKVDVRRLESERMQRAVDSAVQAGSTSRPYPQECAAAFETRLAIERNRNGSVSSGGALGERVRDLASHLRVAK